MRFPASRAVTESGTTTQPNPHRSSVTKHQLLIQTQDKSACMTMEAISTLMLQKCYAIPQSLLLFTPEKFLPDIANVFQALKADWFYYSSAVCRIYWECQELP